MIDWKKKYKELFKLLLVENIIFIILSITTLISTILSFENKDNKISEQQIEITDLKEQIHILKIK